jgi:hypothetical protein
MRVIKEAHIGKAKFIVAPDYVAIQGEDEISGVEHRLQFSRSEAAELANWLNNELNRILPEIIDVKPWQDKLFEGIQCATQTPLKRTEMSKAEPVYDPGPRTASQTVEVKVGDPSLAYRASGGRTSQPGDGQTESIDLAALSASVAVQ